MTRWCVVTLAALCTLVAMLLSVAGAWNRAGLPVERALYASVAVLLTVGAHVIPALCRDDRAWFRAMAAVLWLVCMVAVVAGHLAFFAAAERHAGEVRAVESAPPARSAIIARPLSDVAADLARVEGNIARLRGDIARCPDCQNLPAKLEALIARAGALETEEAEARRRIVLEDAADARKQSALADPVSVRVAFILSVTPDAPSLAVSAASTLVLELLGCLLWVRAREGFASKSTTAPIPKALLPESYGVTAQASAMVAGLSSGVAESINTPSRDLVADVVTEPVTVTDSVTEGMGDTDSALASIRQAGISPTVAAIRQHLKCSQAKAMQLRRALMTVGGTT